MVPNYFVVVAVEIAADMVAAEAVDMVPPGVAHTVEVAEVACKWEAASDVDLVDTMVLPQTWPVGGSSVAGSAEFVASVLTFVVVGTWL